MEHDLYNDQDLAEPYCYDADELDEDGPPEWKGDDE